MTISVSAPSHNIGDRRCLLKSERCGPNGPWAFLFTERGNISVLKLLAI